MTDRQTSSNPHKTAAQAAKAGTIARLLIRFGATADDARALPELGRRIAEELAGVPVSSEATWVLVPHLLQALATVPDDPFSAFGPVAS